MRSNRKILPELIQEKIATFPEYSYGAHKVTLTLKDGKEIREVYIAGNDEIIRVGKNGPIQFDPSDVIDARSEV